MPSLLHLEERFLIGSLQRRFELIFEPMKTKLLYAFSASARVAVQVGWGLDLFSASYLLNSLNTLRYCLSIVKYT